MVVIGIQNMPGTTIMTISDLAGDQRRGEGGGGRDPATCSVGQPATVTLEALAGPRRSRARWSRWARARCPLVGTGAAAREFKVKVRVKDAATEGLRPGPHLRRRDPRRARRRTRSPSRSRRSSCAARRAASAPGVFVVEGKAARFVPVETGMIGGLEIEVKKGLEEGREIVAGPWQSLKDLQDGAAIRTARK